MRPSRVSTGSGPSRRTALAFISGSAGFCSRARRRATATCAADRRRPASSSRSCSRPDQRQRRLRDGRDPSQGWAGRKANVLRAALRHYPGLRGGARGARPHAGRPEPAAALPHLREGGVAEPRTRSRSTSSRWRIARSVKRPSTDALAAFTRLRDDKARQREAAALKPDRAGVTPQVIDAAGAPP